MVRLCWLLTQPGRCWSPMMLAVWCGESPDPVPGIELKRDSSGKTRTGYNSKRAQTDGRCIIFSAKNSPGSRLLRLGSMALGGTTAALETIPREHSIGLPVLSSPFSRRRERWRLDRSQPFHPFTASSTPHASGRSLRTAPGWSAVFSVYCLAETGSRRPAKWRHRQRRRVAPKS